MDHYRNEQKSKDRKNEKRKSSAELKEAWMMKKYILENECCSLETEINLLYNVYRKTPKVVKRMAMERRSNAKQVQMK